MTKWYIALLCMVIFLIPSNLFLKFDPSHAYVHGLLVDYLIPKLYLSDLPILAILGLWFKVSLEKKRFHDVKNPVALIFLLLIIAFFSRQLMSVVPRASLWFFLKLAEMSLFGFFLVMHRGLLQDKKIWWTLTAALLFQSLIGITQFYTQSSVFHSYLALGEVNFSHTIGLAKDSYFSTENILAYGTTAHPNILAGFLVLGGLLVFDFFMKNKTPKTSFIKTCTVVFFSILLWALVLTQSFSAAGTLLLGILFLLFQKPLTNIAATVTKKVNAGIVLILILLCVAVVPFLIHEGSQYFPNNQSFTRRDTLNQAATSMIVDSPITGVGLDNFTPNLEKYSSTKEVVRFLQPAHNAALLWVAETGLIGILLIFTIYFLMKQKLQKIWPNANSFFLPSLILLPIFTLDHYLLTQQSGLLLGLFFLVLFQLNITDF